jgi:hypothetical protein
MVFRPAPLRPHRIYVGNADIVSISAFLRDLRIAGYSAENCLVIIGKTASGLNLRTGNKGRTGFYFARKNSRF